MRNGVWEGKRPSGQTRGPTAARQSLQPQIRTGCLANSGAVTGTFLLRTT
jgi:hypothetical protein